MNVFKCLFVILVLTFTGGCFGQTENRNIVLINVGPSDKKLIARELAIINRLNPKVVALDVAFSGYRGSAEDKLLENALEDTKFLVLPDILKSSGEDYYGREVIFVVSAFARNFVPIGTKEGYVSARDSSQDRGLQKQIELYKVVDGWTYNHFCVETALSFDSVKTSAFVKKNNRIMQVNLKGGKRKFRIISFEELINGKVANDEIEGKIVMLGYLGPNDEDKFSTSGFNFDRPELYGVEYLANIVAQILESE